MKETSYFSLIFLFVFFGKSSAQVSNDLSFLRPASESFIRPSASTIINLPFSNYHFFNPYYFNPAMAGIEGEKQLNGNWNRQLDHSFLLSYEQPISSINSALGMHFSYSSNYSSTLRYFGLAYNYGFQLDNAQLKFGFQFSQINIAFKENFLGSGYHHQKWYNSPSMDLGVAFQVEKLRFGMSVKNIFPTEIISIEQTRRFINVVNGERQFNLSIANTFKLSKEWNWSLALLSRNTKRSNVHDFSSYLSLHKIYFIGATYRTEVDNHWIGFVGVKIKEKVNLQFSFNTQKEDSEDRRFIETLAQYQF